MRLPSILYIFEGVRRTLLRFPVACAASVAACAVAWYMVGIDRPDEDWSKLLLSLVLGIALFYSLPLMNERPALPAAVKPPFVLVAGLLFLAAFLSALLHNGGANFTVLYTHWLFIILLSASVAAYLRAGEETGFWQFNRRLSANLVVSSFYTGALFAGISIALVAVDKLLGVEIGHVVYRRLWCFAMFVFWPWHFMTSTPSNYAELEADASYPKGLKIFTQYVLIPLVTVYFLILYAYMAKILWTQEWPQGWVSRLTSTASVLGLVTFLLLYPVREQPENRWIKVYSKGFCAAAIPLLIMLLIAVFKRTEQYGLTERRYFLVVLALWLLGIFLYFIFSRKPNIKSVPLSCALVALLVSGGPWGAYSVSLSSQAGRLESAMQKGGILAGGKAVKLDHELAPEDRRQLSACLDYIVEYHGLAPLKEYFTQDLGGIKPKSKDIYRAHEVLSRELMSYMGQTYLAGWEREAANTVTLTPGNGDMDIRGYDTVVHFFTRSDLRKESLPDRTYAVVLVEKTQTLRIYKDGVPLLDIPFGGLGADLSKYESTRRVPQDLMKVEGGNDRLKARLYFGTLSGKRTQGGAGIEFNIATGLLFIKEK